VRHARAISFHWAGLSAIGTDSTVFRIHKVMLEDAAHIADIFA